MRVAQTRFFALIFAWAAVLALAASPVRSAPALTIESLLQKGWEIAGYVGTGDNRATIILFKKAGETYFVQCASFHDVTRTPRVSTNCYELR